MDPITDQELELIQQVKEATNFKQHIVIMKYGYKFVVKHFWAMTE